MTPEETKQKGTTCPVCGKPMTIGVMQRVEELSVRSEEDLQLETVNGPLVDGGAEVRMTKSRTFPERPPFVMMVPLQEIISEAIGSPVTSPKVAGPYDKLITAFGGEFNVLLHVTVDKIANVVGERIANGVDKVRKGEIHIDPGYDGVFGVVKLWNEGEEKSLVDASKEQLSLF